MRKKNDLAPPHEVSVFTKYVEEALDNLRLQNKNSFSVLEELTRQVRLATQMPRGEEQRQELVRLESARVALQAQFAASDKAFGEACRVHLAHLKDCWKQTGNPIFVHCAVAMWRFDPSGSFPEWCSEYLEECSRQILQLVSDKSLTASDCASRLPATFGFVRSTWNAFHQIRELYSSELMYRTLYALRMQDLPAQKATAEVLRLFGLENERSLRRRFAALKRSIYRQATTDES